MRVLHSSPFFLLSPNFISNKFIVFHKSIFITLRPMIFFNLISALSAIIFLLFLYPSSPSLRLNFLFQLKDITKPNKRQVINYFCAFYKWSDILIPRSPIVPNFNVAVATFYVFYAIFSYLVFPARFVFILLPQFLNKYQVYVATFFQSSNPIESQAIRIAYLPCGKFKSFLPFWNKSLLLILLLPNLKVNKIVIEKIKFLYQNI